MSEYLLKQKLADLEQAFEKSLAENEILRAERDNYREYAERTCKTVDKLWDLVLEGKKANPSRDIYSYINNIISDRDKYRRLVKLFIESIAKCNNLDGGVAPEIHDAYKRATEALKEEE